jgi:hypothetical protein
MDTAIKYTIVDDANISHTQTNNSMNDVEKVNNISINEFETAIHNFVKENNPKLAILTPCFGSICYVNYVGCIISTIELLNKFNIPMKIHFCRNDSLVPRARNNLIAKAMYNEDTTHILFIDNDISWDPVSILKLLLADKHIVGGVYPLKNYNWNKLIKDPLNPYNSNIVQQWVETKNKSQLKNILSDEECVQNKLLNYNVNYLSNVLSIENNLSKVKHTATGFMLIKRETISKMMEAFPSTKYVDDVNFLIPEENKYAYALFDCGVEEGHYFSEDWLFCDRWTKMGGDVFIDVTINLSHTGIEDYKGCYISTII